MWQHYKKAIVIIAAIIIGGAAIFYAARGQIAMALMERVLVRNMEESPAYQSLGDGLHLVLCGAGGPLTDPLRSGPCVGVVAGDLFFVIDSGTNGARNLARMNWAPGTIHAVLLTHFHSDHIDGLGELAMLRWTMGGHDKPLNVFGPEGVEEIVKGFNQAYQQDSTYRIEHHGEAVVPKTGAGMIARPFKQPQGEDAKLVFAEGGVKIFAFRVSHDPVHPAIGYKFEYKDRVIVISGDTTKLPIVEKMSRNVDLLVHEALSPKLVNVITRAAEQAGNQRLVKITADILDYHTTPVEAAEIAAAADVGHLLLYHIVPPLPSAALEDAFLEGVDDVWSGGLTLGRDGVLISLPAQSKDIIVKELF